MATTKANRISQKEACRLLQKTPSQLRDLVRRGLLDKHQSGNKPLYDRVEVQDLRYAYETLGTYNPSALTVSLLVAKVNRLDRDLRLLMRLQGLERPRLLLSVDEAHLFYESAVDSLLKGDPYDIQEVYQWVDVLLRLDEENLVRIHQATGEPFPPKIFYRIAKRLFAEIEQMRGDDSEIKKELDAAEVEVAGAHRHVLGLAAMFAELDLHRELRDAIRERLDDSDEVNRQLVRKLKKGQK